MTHPGIHALASRLGEYRSKYQEPELTLMDSVFEAAAGVIAACLPCSHVLWKHLAPQISLSWNRLLTMIPTIDSRTSLSKKSSGDNYDRVGRSVGGSSTERIEISKNGKDGVVGSKTYEEHDLSELAITPSKAGNASPRAIYESYV